MKRIDLRPFVPLFLAAAGCAAPSVADLDDAADEVEPSGNDSASPSSGEAGSEPGDTEPTDPSSGDDPSASPSGNESAVEDPSHDPPDLGGLPDEVTNAREYEEWRHELYCAVYSACYGDADACYDSPIPWGGHECQLVDLEQANVCLDDVERMLGELPDAPTHTHCEAAMHPVSCAEVLYESSTPECVEENEEGRPVRQAGQTLLAAVTRGDGWSQAERELVTNPKASRAWLRAARAEHGSIQAFSRLSQELMLHGAPPSLLARCHRAALDEIEHARLCLDIARRLGAGDVDLGAIDLPQARRPSLATMAIEALEEGCWGEGAAAIRASLAATRCSAAYRTTLQKIARDETRHAQLAWSTLNFLLRRDPSLAGVLVEHLETLRARAATFLPVDGGENLAEFGLLAASEREMIAREVLDQIVTPTLQALIGHVAVPHTHA